MNNRLQLDIKNQFELVKMPLKTKKKTRYKNLSNRIEKIIFLYTLQFLIFIRREHSSDRYVLGG
jgi:hypothetical protein